MVRVRGVRSTGTSRAASRGSATTAAALPKAGVTGRDKVRTGTGGRSGTRGVDDPARGAVWRVLVLGSGVP